MDTSHKSTISGWSADPELDYIGSRRPRYFQHPKITESTQISLGIHDRFVETTNDTNNDNKNMNDTVKQGQDSPYTTAGDNPVI